VIPRDSHWDGTSFLGKAQIGIIWKHIFYMIRSDVLGNEGREYRIA